MPRPTWKGHITFGLVNIPVALYPGERRADLSFRMLDSRNQARVRYERVNELTGEEVPWDQIVKAYEYDDGNYVLLEEEDFAKAAVEATKSVEIEAFVDLTAINYGYFDKPYYLVPENKGEKGYVILREALKKSGKVGIAKVVIRTRQHLAAVIPEGNALILDLLRFHQEIRNPDEYDLPGEDLGQYKISDKELLMAQQLIEAMAEEWEPDQFHDEYRDALLKWIEQKAQKGTTEAPEPEEEPQEAGEVVDMMDLLQQSVKQRGKSTTKKRKAS